MSDKMREEFEVFAESRGFDRNYYFSRGIHPNYYDHDTINEMWLAWKASRAALVVELPSDINGEYYADGWNAALMRAEERLSEAGVSYK